MGDPRRTLAGLVAIGALLGAGGARAGGTIHLDAARLRAPLVSPPIEVKLLADPAVIGLHCDGVAGATLTHEPVLEWMMAAPEPGLRVTVTGAGGAIGGPDGNWSCTDASGELTLPTGAAGTYHLYAFANASTATVTVRVESPSRLRASARRALEHAPAITIGAATRPNPVLRSVAGVAGAQARDLGFCRGDRDSFMPVARVTLADDVAQLRIGERVRRVVGGHDAALQLVDRDGRCVDGGAVKAGAYALWAEIERDHPPVSLSLELDDTSRSLDWGDAPELDLATLAEPLVVDGKIARPSARPSREVTRCKPVAGPPSFYLVARAPHPGVELVMVWSRRDQWYLIEGPGVSRCSGDGAAATFDAAPGRYAVWSGGVAGADFAFLVHRSDAVANPLASYAHPPLDLTLAERVLPHFYPFFTAPGADDPAAAASAEALFAAAPDAILVYARVDVEAAARAGEPLIVLAIEHDAADVLTVDGHTRHLPVAALTTTRPRQIALPASASPELGHRFGR